MRIVNLIQLVGIILVMMGDGFFRLIGFQRAPSWYGSVEKNAVPIMILTYLILPQYLAQYEVTKAFEVTLDGTELIFSKLAANRMPKPADLIPGLTKAGLSYVG